MNQGELSAGAIVHRGNCPQGQLSAGATVLHSENRGCLVRFPTQNGFGATINSGFRMNE